MAERKWAVSSLHNDLAQEIAKHLAISPLLAQLLINRGHTTVEACQAFLDVSCLHEPIRMKDMILAITRTVQALRLGEKIGVFADYDADGVCGAAILYRGLTAAGSKPVMFIPERAEGYGLSIVAVDQAKREGISLIITVDNGVSAVAEVAYAKELGIDVVVLDHHMPPPVLPQAVAVVDPHRADCHYPFNDLCGAAVAYKFLTVLAKQLDTFPMNVLLECLQLAAIATVADVMPLIDENRTIVNQGLEQIHTNPLPGISALMKVANVRTLDSQTIAFQIASRLNAAGRMKSPRTAYLLLISNADSEAEALAVELNECNLQRREQETVIVSEIETQFASELKYGRVSVIFRPDLPAGLLGLIAGRLAEKYARPVIVLSSSEEDEYTAKGSCRSGDLEGFSMVDALQAISDTLIRFGGHAKAAGLSVLIENISVMRDALEGYLEKTVPDDTVPLMAIDTFVTPEQLTVELVQELSRLEPCGEGNPSPVFALKDSPITNVRRYEKGDTLAFDIPSDEQALSCIGFGWGSHVTGLSAVSRADVAFAIRLDEYKGKIALKLFIKDVKTSFENPISVIDRLFAECKEHNEFADIGLRNEFYTKAVGVSFDDGQRQAVIATLAPGNPIALVREAHNPKDPNAIRLEHDGRIIGYLRAGIAKELAPLIDKGTGYSAFVTDITGGTEDRPSRGVNLTVIREADMEAVYDEEKRNQYQNTDHKTVKKLVQQALIGVDNAYHASQREAISYLKKGENVLYIAPTGRGKSAVFQSVAAEAALLRNQKTIIVYPLRSLTNDQEYRMKKQLGELGIRVLRANGSLDTASRVEAFHALDSGQWDIALTTPEFLSIHAEHFARNDIYMLVIDEAHHIAEYRRPAYTRLGSIARRIGTKVVCAVTATADNETAQKISQQLTIQHLVVDNFRRDNLLIEDCRNMDADIKKAYIKGLFLSGEKTLVYTHSRYATYMLAESLRNMVASKRDQIAFYHGGLGTAWRQEVERLFRSGEVTLVVATSAFGEGIDLSDIRHVVLESVPLSAVDFTQQAGRAGRDGVASAIHLLYGQSDMEKASRIVYSNCPTVAELRQFYCVLRQQAGPSRTLTLTNKELCEAYSKTSNNTVGEPFVSTALAIFTELALIERETDNRIRTITLLPAGKVELESSLFYQECIAEREAFVEYSQFALQMSAEEATTQVSCPITPSAMSHIVAS